MMTLSALTGGQKGGWGYYDKNHHKIVITRNNLESINKPSIMMIMIKVYKISQARARMCACARARVYSISRFSLSIFFCTYSFLYTFIIIIINRVLINKINNLQDMMIYYDMMILQEPGK